jgi:hypothetical protein
MLSEVTLLWAEKVSNKLENILSSFIVSKVEPV